MSYASKETYNWGSSKKRFEWKEEYINGIVPRDTELEKDLFGEGSLVHTGLNFSKYDHIPVKVKGDQVPPAFVKVNHLIDTLVILILSVYFELV
jgi:ATP-dependent RNA helicase DDX3X